VLSDKELVEGVFVKTEEMSEMLWKAAKWKAAKSQDVDERVIAFGLVTCIDLLSVVLRLLLGGHNDS